MKEITQSHIDLIHKVIRSKLTDKELVNVKTEIQRIKDCRKIFASSSLPDNSANK